MTTNLQSEDSAESILERFGLSSGHGFLYEATDRLPAEFAAWEMIAGRLTSLLAIDGVRDAVAAMPELDCTPLLDSPADLRRAKLLLSTMTQTYVFGSRQTTTHLPPQLARPLYAVSNALGVPPIMSYADYVLCNWRLLDPAAGFTLSNIATRINMYGGTDEAWFILVHVAVEAQAGGLLDLCVRLHQAAEASDVETLTGLLSALGDGIVAMTATFEKMRASCDPTVYFLRVRPFTHGWTNNPALPGGMRYDGVDAFDGPQSFRGETGAQSTVVPAIDAAVGVEHPNDHLNDHLRDMRDYMPPAHREFLEWMETSSVRTLVRERGDAGLTSTYSACIRQLAEFRNVHLKIAHDYVYAHKGSAIDSASNPASVGTGGTPPIDYLRHHRDATIRATDPGVE
ncbi:MAG: hypothetical protein GC159_07710 [Phycisphaera sp.]|nr:hypothetical protein [Phycisphaera sp.]